MTDGPIVMVAGSRTWEDGELIYRRLAIMDPQPSLVMHGGAKGADNLADRACRRLGIPTHVLPPLYAVHGAKAPLRRTDSLLAGGPDLLVAFWDGQSAGTGYAISQANRLGIEVEVVYE